MNPIEQLLKELYGTDSAAPDTLWIDLKGAEAIGIDTTLALPNSLCMITPEGVFFVH